MADVTQDVEQTTDVPTEDTAPAEALKTDTKTVSYERFREVNSELKKLREAQAERDRQQREAEEKRLADEKRWEELAEARKAEAEALKPYQAKAERYEQALQKQLAAERKGLPGHIITLLDRLDPAEQLEWIAENRETITKPSAPNINAQDRSGNAVLDLEAEKERLRKTGMYNY